MKLLLVANWKMNPQNEKEAINLFETVKKGIKKKKGIEVVICPPFVYLPSLHSRSKMVSLGAQNVFYKEKGAFTGEISAAMLKSLGVAYVILGHSEVRINLKETDEIINKKVKECLESGLRPIICVGETEEEKQKGQKAEVIERQLAKALERVPRKYAKKITIAYEPVWAIGTGQNCQIDEAMGSFLLVRKIMVKLYGKEIANATRIIYGGSVTAGNAASYINEGLANGILVGSASLDSKEFLQIINSIT